VGEYTSTNDEIIGAMELEQEELAWSKNFEVTIP
jgi:hypothetical protein